MPGPLLWTILAPLATSLAAQTPAPARPDYTAADASFVQDMIVHHAQAVVMSDWAPTHGASPTLRILAKRISLSQRDEIGLLQRWLLDRRLAVPDPLHSLMTPGGPVPDTASRDRPGMEMSPLPMGMAGMLTPDQLRQLDAARGTEFDRLYLQGMIRHHEGALTMVAHLYASPGAGQEPDISGFANDIDAGQRAEIARMHSLLSTVDAK